METTARAVWEVVAGVLPGQPMDEFTRRWVVTSGAGSEDERAMAKLALDYLDELSQSGVNWVRADYVFF